MPKYIRPWQPSLASGGSPRPKFREANLFLGSAWLDLSFHLIPELLGWKHCPIQWEEPLLVAFLNIEDLKEDCSKTFNPLQLVR